MWLWLSGSGSLLNHQPYIFFSALPDWALVERICIRRHCSTSWHCPIPHNKQPDAVRKTKKNKYLTKDSSFFETINKSASAAVAETAQMVLLSRIGALADQQKQSGPQRYAPDNRQACLYSLSYI